MNSTLRAEAAAALRPDGASLLIAGEIDCELVPQGTLPLTSARSVDLVITELAVLLREHAPGISVDDIRAATAATLIVADDLTEMRFA